MAVRILLQSAKPTMRLARPILDSEGRLLAGAGTQLNDAVARVLRRMAMQSVVVTDADGVPSWDTVRPLAEELAELEKRFGSTRPTGPLAELQAAIGRHFARRAARLEVEPGFTPEAAASTAEPEEQGPAVGQSALPPPPSPETLRRQLVRLRTVPTLPKVLETVVGALEDQDVDFENVADLIETDQALTSQILRLANSAFYSSAGAVSRVPQALVILGAVVSRSVLLSSAVLDIRQVGLHGFWEHSLGCAVAAGAIAKVTGRGQVEEVTAAGLLHDLGKVVLYKELPQVFEEVVTRAAVEKQSFRQIERAVLQVDHGEIASWLVEKWRFPVCLAEAISFHHEPGRARKAGDEAATVHVANSLVRGLGYGSGGDALVPAIDPAAWARLGLTVAKLDAVLAIFETDLDQALNYALFV
jgi:HD-like signal output (HDOD) protein